MAPFLVQAPKVNDFPTLHIEEWLEARSFAALCLSSRDICSDVAKGGGRGINQTQSNQRENQNQKLGLQTVRNNSQSGFFSQKRSIKMKI